MYEEAVMSDDPTQPISDPALVRDGINVPDAVERLLADMDALKARVATLETKVT